MGSTTSHSKSVKAVRKELLAELAVLKKAVMDENALMAGNEVLTSLQKLDELRVKYSEAAWDAHCEFLGKEGWL